MNNQPKPATGGEWTGAWLSDFCDDCDSLSETYVRIADAHNAAVKEAYQKGYEDGNGDMIALNKQLAVAREALKEIRGAATARITGYEAGDIAVTALAKMGEQ